MAARDHGAADRPRRTAATVAVRVILHLRNIYWLETPRLVCNVLTTALVVGPVLGYVALRCRSVWPAVILHYANNLTYYLRH